VKAFNYDEVDSSWHPFFKMHEQSINQLLSTLSNENTTPARANIFRAFHEPLDCVKVVIFGQDPYPGSGVADGLAFSTQSSIPASLRNIFKELSEDLGIAVPTSADLSPWAKQGVLLLNRTLTTTEGERNAHLESGWKDFTEDCARLLGERGVIAILWGAYAQELSQYFKYALSSPHPSPLSAYRGFFGSKPFSRANEALRAQGKLPIDWSL
jgi:uracil-DNA glycosylase